MKSLVSLSLALFLLSSLTACNPSETSKAKDADVAFSSNQITPISCEKGDLTYFDLVDLPNLKEIEFLPIPAANLAEVHGLEDETYSIRLEMCLVDDNLELKRVTAAVDYTTYKLIEVTQEARIEGLNEALFGGDMTKLDLLIPFIRTRSSFTERLAPTNLALSIRGAVKDQAVLAAIVEKSESGSISFAKDSDFKFLLGGTFEYVEADKPRDECKGDVASGSFKLGTATFEWAGIYGIGTPGAQGPRILCSVSVSDSASQLGAAANQTLPVTRIDWQKTHHNDTDKYVFKTESATYSINLGVNICKESNSPECSAASGRIIAIVFDYNYANESVKGIDRDCIFPLDNVGTCN